MKRALLYAGLTVIMVAFICSTTVLADDTDPVPTGSVGNTIGLSIILPSVIIMDTVPETPPPDGSGCGTLEGDDPEPPPPPADDFGWDTHNG
jgi:xanthine/uracil permease